ncbi:RNA polymerase sigma factor [Actinomadura citrea]|uniref:RNA polymerase sigma factor n=1 Tax=Actinomadura citrea TaxID=46158 RepID=UPI003CE47258
MTTFLAVAVTWPTAEEFLADQYPHLRRFLQMNGCPPECADELTNDACKIVYDRWERLRDDPRFQQVLPRAYLFRVGARKWHRCRPSEQRWRNFLTDVDNDSLNQPITVDTAERVVDRVVTWEVVRKALAQMDVPARQVLWLRHAEDFSTRETAQILQVADGTVKYRLHGAVKQFRSLVLGSHLSIDFLGGAGWDVTQ